MDNHTRKLHYKDINSLASEYVGEEGSIFYDPATALIRIGNGTSPGGATVRTREVILADHNYYVDSTTGSDTNNGKTPTTAWATIQRAINFIAQDLDMSQAWWHGAPQPWPPARVIVHCAAGNYSPVICTDDSHHPNFAPSVVITGPNPGDGVATIVNDQTDGTGIYVSRGH